MYRLHRWHSSRPGKTPTAMDNAYHGSIQESFTVKLRVLKAALYLQLSENST